LRQLEIQKGAKMKSHPKVGVGVILKKDGKVLIGKRRGSHGEGTWAFPGGHLEFGESLENCAVREILEETGLKIKNVRIATFTNDVFKNENKHYATLYVTAEVISGQPKIMELEKCEEWRWVEWGRFPHPLFVPLENLLKQNYHPF